MTALIFIATGAAVLILVALAVVHGRERTDDLNRKGARPNVRKANQPKANCVSQ